MIKTDVNSAMGIGVLFSLVLLMQGCLLVSGRSIPFTPCPRLFSYHESETNEIFGSFQFPNDHSGKYEVEVSMSIPVKTDKKIKIIQRTPTWRIQNGEDLEFYVQLPLNDTLPQLTSVWYNGKVYCTGPPAEGQKVTRLSDKLSVIARQVKPGEAPATPPPVTTETPAAAPEAAPASAPLAHNKHSEECGVDINFQPLILGGNVSKVGEYPWMVAIFVRGEPTYNFHCAGNLISDRHVLTAAHCVTMNKGKKINPENMLIVLGTHRINNWATRGTRLGVRRSAVHRDYTKPADADIALLTLEEPVQFTLTIKPICLWTEKDDLNLIVGKTGVVAGWGRREDDDTYLTELRQVIMPVVSQETCLWSDARFTAVTSYRTFCAGDRNGPAPCTGDSGGGFIMKRDGKWTLRGIVSFALITPGPQICDGKLYTVFSDVTKFRDWITEKMKK